MTKHAFSHHTTYITIYECNETEVGNKSICLFGVLHFLGNPGDAGSEAFTKSNTFVPRGTGKFLGTFVLFSLSLPPPITRGGGFLDHLFIKHQSPSSNCPAQGKNWWASETKLSQNSLEVKHFYTLISLVVL